MDVRGIGVPYNAAQAFIDEKINDGLANKVAIYYQEEQVTYKQLQDRMNQFGNGLKQIGIGIESRMLIMCLDSPEFIVSFFGAVKIGAVPIPVNTMMQPTDYEYYLNNSRAKVLVAHQELWDKIKDLRHRFLYLKHVIVISEDEQLYPNVISYKRLLEESSRELEPVHTTYDDSAFWLFSSGSTGNPKGVIHLQHDMEFALTHYAKHILKMTEDDITFSASKLFFAYGLGNAMYFPLGVGASTILMPERARPENVFEMIEKYKPTVFFGVPTLYGAMIDYIQQTGRTFDLSSIRICVSAGEALPSPYILKWKDMYQLDILDGIGSTEALHIFLSNRIGDIREGSSGKLVPGYETKIVDELGKLLPPNEIGDLLIKGDSIAQGYWNLHEECKQKFRGEWLATGDKYYMDEEGYYWYCGRSDDMLKVGGIWVSPTEIENCLLEHEAVLEVAVIGESNERDLIQPKAYIVLKKGLKPTVELETELKDFVKKQLAPYKYPRRVEFIEELPKTPTGKIQRFKLRVG